ncbi:hypothetical protein GCM10022226_11600 [Sphaerisporangium flaviroseum]|uniref:Uncharacterized protein n=1 Tax=Sphaerisporangium flaviroseum TaxID=509199 RepID=A0ABP7HJK9_9ACTN
MAGFHIDVDPAYGIDGFSFHLESSGQSSGMDHRPLLGGWHGRWPGMAKKPLLRARPVMIYLVPDIPDLANVNVTFTFLADLGKPVFPDARQRASKALISRPPTTAELAFLRTWPRRAK